MNRSTVSHCRYGFSYFDISVPLLWFFFESQFLRQIYFGFLDDPENMRSDMPTTGRAPFSWRTGSNVPSSTHSCGQPTKASRPWMSFRSAHLFHFLWLDHMLIILVDNDHDGQSKFNRTRSHRRCIDQQISWGRLRRSWEGRLPRCDY